MFIQIRGDKFINIAIKNEKERFRAYIEQIIFQKAELGEIRALISEMKKNSESSHKLKTKLLESRARILKDVIDFIEFYMKGESENNQNLNQDSNVNAIKEDLNQKNILLQNIAKRLQKL